MSSREASVKLQIKILFVPQFKKPPIPVRHCKDDRTQGTCAEGLASSNIYKSMNAAYVGKRYTGLNNVLATFTRTILSIDLAR